MMSNNKDRKEELMEYVRLLEGMQRSGFHCNKEMGQAMEELHALMLPRIESVQVVVVQRGLTVEGATAFYADLLGATAKVRKDVDWSEDEPVVTGHYTVSTQDRMVLIINEDKAVRKSLIPDKITHIVNNTNNYNLPEQLGFKVG